MTAMVLLFVLLLLLMISLYLPNTIPTFVLFTSPWRTSHTNHYDHAVEMSRHKITVSMCGSEKLLKKPIRAYRTHRSILEKKSKLSLQSIAKEMYVYNSKLSRFSRSRNTPSLDSCALYAAISISRCSCCIIFLFVPDLL